MRDERKTSLWRCYFIHLFIILCRQARNHLSLQVCYISEIKITIAINLTETNSIKRCLTRKRKFSDRADENVKEIVTVYQLQSVIKVNIITCQHPNNAAIYTVVFCSCCHMACSGVRQSRRAQSQLQLFISYTRCCLSGGQSFFKLIRKSKVTWINWQISYKYETKLKLKHIECANDRRDLATYRLLRVAQP